MRGFSKRGEEREQRTYGFTEDFTVFSVVGYHDPSGFETLARELGMHDGTYVSAASARTFSRN
jgi:hypothetical protein